MVAFYDYDFSSRDDPLGEYSTYGCAGLYCTLLLRIEYYTTITTHSTVQFTIVQYTTVVHVYVSCLAGSESPCCLFQYCTCAISASSSSSCSCSCSDFV